MENQKNNWIVHTDLAYDKACEYADMNVKGFEETKEIITNIPIIKHTVNKEASTIINKEAGTYYTINLEQINYHDHKTSLDIENALATVLRRFITSYNLENKSCLVVGLGNDNVTPDAVGPFVVDNIIVTRHLSIHNELNEGYSIVSAISPGVMGTTGIETYDIIEAVRNKIDIDFIIVVDALSSSSISRVNNTIQLTDTGIAPGSGVGNKRKEISYKTMRIPVFAVGIPTVVDAVSIVADSLKYALKYLNLNILDQVPKSDKLVSGGIKKDYENVELPSEKIKEQFLGKIGLLEENELKNFFTDVLTPNGYNLMVTNKDIDLEVEDLSKIVAWGINKSLHKNINETM